MKFITYIISYGRPNNLTANYLEKINYTGEWKIVVDNSDKTIPKYIERWGEAIKNGYTNLGKYIESNIDLFSD